ncbi:MULTISPECIES: hypothetical protein [unclassified Rhizobium]|uniref:hypothetical protein n=1 Tax=unclassified Rhizobium TaxID=2613769 RepID=UPI001FFE028D|nr:MULTISPECIES: hypothetical protein [unclassified Rhizobium]
MRKRQIHRYAASTALLLFPGTLGASFVSAADLVATQANDNLNAVLWDQTSVESKGNALGAYALGQVRLDQALADKTWTAVTIAFPDTRARTRSSK